MAADSCSRNAEWYRALQLEIALRYVAEVQKDKEEGIEKEEATEKATETETETKALKAFSTPLVSGASIVLDPKAFSTPFVRAGRVRAPGKRRRIE